MGNIDIELILIKYLQFNSHHPSQHKCSVARAYLGRAKNIPSTDGDKLSQVQHVVDALKINGCTDQFIRSGQLYCFYKPVSNQQRFCHFAQLQGISEKKSQEL